MNTSLTLHTTAQDLFTREPDNKMKVDTEVQEPYVVFNHRNSRHRNDLLHWCRVHWDTMFKRNLDQANPVYYHDCCSCFSRRGFSKIAGHPALQSCSILRIPSFKMVTNGDQFYRWLLGIYITSTARGQRTYFPAVNRFHVEEEIIGTEAIDEETTCLKKRVDDMSKNIEEHNKKLRELESMNQQLLASSKSWHQKYIDLLEKQENQLPVEFQTPLKKKTKYFEGFDLY